MKFLALFIASLMANLKVLLLSAVGSVMALERYNIMGPEATKHINIAYFYVLAPALITASVAKTITFKSMLTLWFMPFNLLVTYIVGSIIGWILLKMVKVPHSLRGLMFGCCASGNQGNIILIIVPALCKEKDSPFGATDVCYPHGMAYATLSLAFANLYFWLFTYNAVRLAAAESTASLGNSAEEDIESKENSVQEAARSPSGNYPDQTELKCQTETLSKVMAVSETKQLQVPEWKEKVLKRFKDIVAKYLNWKAVLAPPTIATIAGLVLGSVPPLKKFFIGESAPLRVVEDATSMLGDAAIPIITIVMGANLIRGLRKSDLKPSLVVSIILVRNILLPAFGVLFVKTGIHFHLIRSDPLYQFILMLQWATPPAISLASVSQLFGVEKQCSVIFLSTYGLAPLSLTLWSTYYLWLVL